MIRDIQDEILRLKKEKDVCILAHSYQAREITEIADFTGDSYALSVKAATVPHKNVLLCGVRFMAETVKILSLEKRVYLANAVAGCPMAEQMDRDMIAALKAQYPEYTVVAYINTTAALKTICDVCVTSSSAVKIVRKMKEDKILFIPDCNLGRFVADQIPEKQFKLLQGGCPIHARVRKQDVKKAREQHPNALLLVHPECQPEVFEQADYVGSTSGIMEYAKNSSAKEFIIGTEISIAEHLQYDCPEKRFYPLTKELICPNMKATTLVDVLSTLRGESGEEIAMDEQTRIEAKKCIDAMIRLGG
ncbi:MAG: quinolinate synthase NadA [Eubacteriales bacterium]|nr:quinolinate synthase NadA [Eubacteriales bacterium]